MRTVRVAIVLFFSAFVLMSADGALAASALSDTTSATEAQYGAPTPQQESLGESVVGGTGGSGNPVGSGNRGDTLGSGSPDEAVQAPRQVQDAGGAKLPFTGYAAISMLLIGLAMLSAGVLVRRAAPRTPLT